jgi:O-antigen/teichoic acid export membrane protein
MLMSPRRYLPEKAFLRKLFALASGTIVGQAIVVASSPLLTRLFTPAEFGQFAVLAAVIAIAGIAACWRLEFAVLALPDDADAAAVLQAAVVVALLMTLATTAAVWFLGDWFVVLVDAAPLAPWLWLIPCAVLIWGLGGLCTYWSLRRGNYRRNGLNRTLTLGTQAGGQIALGLLGMGSPGLMLGYLCGYVVRLMHHAALIAPNDRRLLLAPTFREVRQTARENWRYPVFSAPSSLLHTLCEMLPAIFIAALFGPATAGLYALAHRLMGLPVKLLGEAASHVFFGEGRKLAGRELRRFFLRTMCMFGGLAILGMLPILLFAPPLFALAFGEAWREAGVIVQLLVPLHFARFIAGPVSQLFVVLRRQDVYFFSSILNSTAIAASFAIGYLFDFSANATILLFSSASAAVFAVELAAAARLVWRSERQPPPAERTG